MTNRTRSWPGTNPSRHDGRGVLQRGILRRGVWGPVACLSLIVPLIVPWIIGCSGSSSSTSPPARDRAAADTRTTEALPTEALPTEAQATATMTPAATANDADTSPPAAPRAVASAANGSGSEGQAAGGNDGSGNDGSGSDGSGSDGSTQTGGDVAAGTRAPPMRRPPLAAADAEPPSRPRMAIRRGQLDLSFDDLEFPIQPDQDFERSMLTDRIEGFDGQQITVRGFILAASVFQQSGIKQFVLVRDNQQCCFGPGAYVYHNIQVEMAEGKSADFSIRPVTVTGTLSIKPWHGPDKKCYSVYHLTATSVR